MLLQVLRTYTVTVVNSDVVTVNADGSKTHCRTLRATDDCDNSSLYNQCIRVTCVPAVSKLMSGDSVASNVKSETGFDVYPVPFKDRIQSGIYLIPKTGC